MYYTYFGLTRPPFKITPDTDFFYSGGNRGAILEALIYAITQGEGIVKVTGEVGSGKTMLCRMLQARLPQGVESVYLVNPSVAPEEILHAIAFEMQLPLSRDADRLQVMQALHAYLLERHAQGQRVVVFVEESQSMPVATLEEIRLLSNLETQHSKLLQIVLFGQPELDEMLRQPEIRQLRERITHSFYLQPLAIQQAQEYLSFRLRAAGYRGPDLFGRRVVNYMNRAAGGLTRRLNLVADKTLLAAFAENTHTLRLRHARAAVRDCEFSQAAPPPWPRFAAGAVLLGTGMTIGAIAYGIYGTYRPAEPAVVAPAQQTQTPRPAPPVNPVPVPVAEAASPAPAPQAAPAPASPPEKSGPIASPVDLLESRLQTTREWLAREPPGTHSIQLMGTDNPEQLKRHLKILSKYIDEKGIFVYRTFAKGKPSVTVLYGSFPGREEAAQALSQLPASVKGYRPYLRTVQGIRAEIGGQNAS